MKSPGSPVENLYRFIKSIQQKTTFEPNEIDGYKAQAVLEVAYESSRSGSWSAGRMSNDSRRITINTEDYRSRRESSLVRFAQSAAEQVRRTGQPRLLEAMNPFERRLVHTALGDSKDVETVSEGDGLYKRIRIYYRSSERKL